MIQVLLYSRKSTAATDQLAEQLQSVGFSVEQTQSLNIPRLILNSYQVVHFVIDELPLSVKESVFMTLIKSLGKVTLLSIYNFENKVSKKTFSFLCPDGLTVSQTNYLKFFRGWNCPKIILPCLFEVSPAKQQTKATESSGPILIPLYSDLNTATKIKTKREVYFDARALLADANSASIRKSWAQLIRSQKVSNHFHLILSDQKVEDLINQEALTIVLADSEMNHMQFTGWVENTINKNHFIILNDQQATGFSRAWTSGRNCQVISYATWATELNSYLAKPAQASLKTNFKSSELVEPLMNDLSRLYTKILHQKASLLAPHSANMTK